MNKFAYIRVSTRDQNEARQLLAISDSETGAVLLFPLHPNALNLLILPDTKLLDIMTRK